MKKLLALLLAVVMLLSLTACGGSGGKSDDDDDDTTKKPKVSLKNFDMTCEPDGVEGPAMVNVSYPRNFSMEEKDWCVILTDEDLDVTIEVYFTNDYNCYAVNEEYAEEAYFFYESDTYGDYEGYACMIDEYSSDVEVNVYLDCVAEMDDVYMTFRISSASQDLDADPKELYALEEVRQVLESVEYTAPEE